MYNSSYTYAREEHTMKTFFPVTSEEAARICAAPEPSLLDRARNRVNRDAVSAYPNETWEEIADHQLDHDPTPAQAARHDEDNPCIIRGTE